VSADSRQEPARGVAEAPRPAQDEPLDAALLDVHLGGTLTKSFSLGEALAGWGVPVVFATAAGRDPARR
jgi:hypothetical protein